LQNRPIGPQGSFTAGAEVLVVEPSTSTSVPEPSDSEGDSVVQEEEDAFAEGAISPTMPQKRTNTAKNFILVTLYGQ